ncbi:MAG: type II toxin-antitoxin system RelE family toxin [Candidatus Binatia bacterium]
MEERRRIRIGDYRVIYEIDDRRRLIKVMRIRHQREVYR